MFGCKAYALKQTRELPKKAKLDPRANIGYLVGYDSTNIFRIWNPSLEKVIRCRDVTFDNNSKYDLYDIDIMLIEEAHKVIETLETPTLKLDSNIEDEPNQVFDTPEIPESTPELQTHQPISSPENQTIPTDIQKIFENSSLPTPRQIPEITKVPTTEPLLSASTEHSNRAIRNIARQRNEISSTLSTSNIIDTQRTRKPSRRHTYIVALQDVSKLLGYHSAFSTHLREIGSKRNAKIHQSTLPPESKTWKQMLAHPYTSQFKIATNKEFNTLLAKKTFEYVDEYSEEKPLPLMWVFKYKFDSDGYLIKYKARLYARGDLQSTDEDTYAATLAAQTFRAMMSLVAAYDLETRQYDAINAFVNALLTKPRIC